MKLLKLVAKFKIFFALKSLIRIWLLVGFILVLISSAFSQSDLVKKPISLNVTETRLEEVLMLIEEQSGISFAFNSNTTPLNALVTYKAVNEPLEFVLDYIATTLHVRFELIEKQIVLLPNPDAPPLEFTLSGNVTDNQTGESLIGATILIDHKDHGTISNGYGFYSIPLSYGKHSIQIFYLGYEIIADTVHLVANTTYNLNLNQSIPQLKEVIVQGYMPPNVILIQTGKINLSTKSVAESPAALGEKDVLKSLERIPGIQLQSEGSTFFYVRGGNKDQNLILIDDAPIYNPTHMLGLFSSIIPSAANSIDVYKSDFPLSKGGRLSSVIDIKTKEGNKNKFSAWGNIGLISTELGIEGPLKKGRNSYILSGRLSRVKWILKQGINDLDKAKFYDLTGKANFELNNKNKLYLSFYTGSDKFTNSTTGLEWSNFNGSVRLNKIINDNTFVNTILYGSNYKYLFHINLKKNESWRSRIGELGIKTNFTHFINSKQDVGWGFSIVGRTINPGNLTGLDSVPAEFVVSVKNNIETVGHFQHTLKFGNKWGIKYGVRASLWTSIGESFEFTYDTNGLPADTIDYNTGVPYHYYFQLEPRVSASYFINEISSIKGSFDRSTQNLHLITNSISPFTSFEVWLPSGPTILPQINNQFSLGYYRFLPNAGISLQVESYYKILQNQIDYESHASTLLNPTIESELLFGATKTYGIELFAKKEAGRLRGMAGYTISKATSYFNELNNGKSFNAYADRPHNITLNLNFDISLRVTLNANFIYNTGTPFSSPSSFYKFDGNEIPIYSKKNNSRLPAYHRLDFSVKFILNKNLASNFRHSLELSIYNLYGRKNPIFINFNKTIIGDGSIKVPTNLLSASRISSQTYIYGFAPSINYKFRF